MRGAPCPVELVAEKRGAAVVDVISADRKPVAALLMQEKWRKERHCGTRATYAAHDDADRRPVGAGVDRQHLGLAETAGKSRQDLADRLRPRDDGDAAARLHDRRRATQP